MQAAAVSGDASVVCPPGGARALVEGLCDVEDARGRQRAVGAVQERAHEELPTAALDDHGAEGPAVLLRGPAGLGRAERGGEKGVRLRAARGRNMRVGATGSGAGSARRRNNR